MRGLRAARFEQNAAAALVDKRALAGNSSAAFAATPTGIFASDVIFSVN
jgi:hypothetical protein